MNQATISSMSDKMDSKVTNWKAGFITVVVAIITAIGVITAAYMTSHAKSKPNDSSGYAGIVRDKSDGSLVSWAAVVLTLGQNAPRYTLTDSEGGFMIQVPVGTTSARLTIEKEGFETKSLNVDPSRKDAETILLSRKQVPTTQMKNLLLKPPQPSSSSGDNPAASVSQQSGGDGTVQLATTGKNSPISGNQITITLGKAMSPLLKAKVESFLKSAPEKRKVSVDANQVSSAAPFPSQFGKVLNDSGWALDRGVVKSVLCVGCMRDGFQGAVIASFGVNEVSCNEQLPRYNDDPVCYIVGALKMADVPLKLSLSSSHDKGTIDIHFLDGFPTD